MVHLKLITISLAKDHATAKSPMQRTYFEDVNDKIADILLSLTKELPAVKKSDAKKGSNLDQVKNAAKRVGILSNYCQILLPLCTARIDFTQTKI